jgi:hypothetical protein
MHLTGELVGGRIRLDELIDIEHRARTLARAIARVRRLATFRPNDATAMSSQVLTATDIAAGRIRLPKPAKVLFPGERTRVLIALRGHSLLVSYDPRLGPDRERSAVLQVGRTRLESVAKAGDRLYLAARGSVVELE